MSKRIHIVEVGPRDGLQNEKKILTVDERIELINKLSLCGFREIEVGSFVSPKWVPQMEHTADVFQGLKRHPAVHYSALVPNNQGMDEAISAGLDHVSIFTAASEAFTAKNINCTIDESFDRFIPIIQKAQRYNVKVRGYLSCVIECPFSGQISPLAVQQVAKRLWNLGCYEVSLGDTIGKGTPASLSEMIKAVAQEVPLTALAIHCHDTYGQAIKNIQAAIELGIGVVDAAINGLGGCPYAGQAAKGNVATQHVLELIKRKGYTTSLEPKALQEGGQWLSSLMTKK